MTAQVKAADVGAQVHGNTTIQPGDFIAVGDSPDDPRKKWGRVVAFKDEKVKVYPETGVSCKDWFMADVVAYEPRDAEVF